MASCSSTLMRTLYGVFDEEPWWPCVSLMRTLHGAFTNLVHSLFLAAALRFLSCTCMSQKESGNIKLMSLSTLLTHCHPNVHFDVYQILYICGGSSCKLLNIALAWKHKNHILLGNLWQQELSKLCGIISPIFYPYQCSFPFVEHWNCLTAIYPFANVAIVGAIVNDICIFGKMHWQSHAVGWHKSGKTAI